MIPIAEQSQKLHAKIQKLSTDAERQKLYVVLDEQLQKQFPEVKPGKYHYSLITRDGVVYLQMDKKRKRDNPSKKISKSDQKPDEGQGTA